MRSANAEFRGNRWYTAYPGPRGSSILLVIVAALSGVGAIAAGVAYQQNAQRASAYREDPLCWTPILFPASQEGSACSVEAAQVADRWITAHRGSKYYHLALTTRDGVVDTVELQGSDRHLLWNESKEKAPVMVQRFRETETGQPHVTIVTRMGSIAKTEWNPAWRANDAVDGVAVLSLCAVGALITLVGIRAWQRRDVTPTLAFQSLREF
jgi:hypothetical protein